MNIHKFKKIFVYPYNFQFTPLLRHLISNGTDFVLMSPKSWGLCGRDASFADGGVPVGLTVVDSFDDYSQFDCLIVPEYCHDAETDMHVKEIIDSFIQRSIEIFYLGSSNETIDVEKSNYRKLHCFFDYDIEIHNETTETAFLPIELPVVTICGLLPDINKFDVQISINRYFTQNGYKTLCITSKKYAELFDMISYPK